MAIVPHKTIMRSNKNFFIILDDKIVIRPQNYKKNAAPQNETAFLLRRVS
jgi:hypothetical protein